LSTQQQIIEQNITELLDRTDVIKAAVVVTVDGHLCATAQQQDYPLDRLATMGSSFMSLGDTITAELSMGTCQNIISENQQGIVVFMHINSSLVLITLTSDQHALGTLLSYSRICAETMNTGLEAL